ncbi:MAG: bacteriorhodopsin-like [Planctomycetota bacterium]
METLSAGQYGLVYKLLSLTSAAMIAAGLFFWGSREQVLKKFRPALTVSALVVFIAGYHYFRIFQSWEGAFVLQDGNYVPSAAGFNDAYRYADWLITVPLQLVELVAVLALSRSESGGMLKKLVVASVLMIGLGYPGEVAVEAGTKWMWWAASMIPFLYILGTLTTKLGPIIAGENGEVGAKIRLARNVLLATWLFYPISYLFPILGVGGASGETLLQVGYTIADLTAKAGYGIVIYQIARAKTRVLEEAGTAQAA